MLREIRVDEVPRGVRIQSVVAIVNREGAVLTRKTEAKLKRFGRKTGTIPMDAMRAPNIASNAFPELFTADEIITGTIDLASYPLDQALTSETDRSMASLSSDEQFHRIDRAYRIANIYYLMDNEWMNCLWRDYYLDRSSNVDLLLPANAADEKNFAASEYRQESRSFANSTSAIRFWQKTNVNAQRAMLALRKRVVAIKRTGQRREFVVRTPRHDSKFPPRSLIAELKSADGVTHNLLDTPLPAAPSLNLRLLLHVWDILRSIAEINAEEVGKNTAAPTLESLMRFSYRIKRTELADVLARCTSSPTNVVFGCIDFLTYVPRSKNAGGLWARPLVQYSKDHYCIVAPSLLGANLLRCIEFWLRIGNVDLGKRGEDFECDVRASIATALAESETLRNTYSCPNALEIGGEEVDLLFRIGRTIMLGEMKFHVFPSDPIELHNYYETLDDAVVQVKRKAEIAKEDIKTVEKILGIPAVSNSQSTIVPFVLTNLAIGAGSERSGVPILDERFLLRYLKDGRFEFMVTVMPEGEATSESATHMYKDEAEAERDCWKHFLHQPIHELYVRLAKPHFRPIPTLADRPAAIAYYVIDFSDVETALEHLTD